MPGVCTVGGGGGGMLNFRVDRRITCQEAVVSYNWNTDKIVLGAIFSTVTCAVYTNSSRCQ